MRTFIFTITTLMLLTSCAGTYKQASHISSKAYIGMPVSEFKQLAGKKASIEVMEAGYTVYKMKDYDAWTGATVDTKFYYFDPNAKLVKIDGGEFKEKRYRIEVINH